MKTVAIISEYNPFHLGHKYQVDKIRESFGNDTRIIAIMSGNYTQRGDVAIMDKSLRAETAVRCGINLVLELPFPFSMSSAEFFAKSGVKIINSIGVVDYLSFGSECGDIDKLSNIARVMISEEYNEKLNQLISKKTNLGYPKLCEMAYSETTKSVINKELFSPNNILALEYIKALYISNSKIKPHTIMRNGSGYNEKNITEYDYQSATAIRALINRDIYSALNYIPDNAKETVLEHYKNKEFPCDAEKLSTAIISYFRLNSPSGCDIIHDAVGGLYNRLQSASFEAETISQLTELADTKKFTTARIRRAIWNSYFGVTSSIVKKFPLYTQILAMDNVGKSILKEIKKMSDFPVLTKPSSDKLLSMEAKEQKTLSDKADFVFHLTKPKFISGGTSLKTTPFIMK